MPQKEVTQTKTWLGDSHWTEPLLALWNFKFIGRLPAWIATPLKLEHMRCSRSSYAPQMHRDRLGQEAVPWRGQPNGLIGTCRLPTKNYGRSVAKKCKKMYTILIISKIYNYRKNITCGWFANPVFGRSLCTFVWKLVHKEILIPQETGWSTCGSPQGFGSHAHVSPWMQIVFQKLGQYPRESGLTSKRPGHPHEWCLAASSTAWINITKWYPKFSQKWRNHKFKNEIQLHARNL
jgi:hypothetical protein